MTCPPIDLNNKKGQLDEGINYITENIDDDNYESSPDTEKYKEWELKERFLNEMVELNKELREIRKRN